jgi:hypothetical protein
VSDEPKLFDDTVDLLAALDEAGAEYVAVGAHALAAAHQQGLTVRTGGAVVDLRDEEVEERCSVGVDRLVVAAGVGHAVAVRSSVRSPLGPLITSSATAENSRAAVTRRGVGRARRGRPGPGR